MTTWPWSLNTSVLATKALPWALFSRAWSHGPDPQLFEGRSTPLAPTALCPMASHLLLLSPP